jgi:hypothetical protein
VLDMRRAHGDPRASTIGSNLMQQRIAIVLAVIVAALVALLVWLSRADVSEIGAKPAASDDIAPRAAAVVVQPSSDGSSLADQRSAVSPTAPAKTTHDARAKKPTDPTTDFDATVIVHCTSKTTHQPLAGIRVWLEKKGAAVGGSIWVNATHARFGEGPMTEADGAVEIDVPSGVELRSFASGKKRDAGDANQDVAALFTHERRAIVLELTVGDDVHFFGLVRARDDDRPIAGARVSLLSVEDWTNIEGEGFGPKETALYETKTSADGRFELATASWKRPFVRVVADGFALTLVSPTIGHHDTEDRAQVIVLEPGAAIEATVLDERAAPIAKAEVVAWTESYRIRNGLSDPSSAGMSRARWTGTTGADGRCTLEDISAHVPLTLLVKRDGKLVLTLGSKVELEAGEVRSLRLQIGAGCRVSGSLVDEKGRPIASQAVWRVRAIFPETEKHYISRFDSIDGKATTDADGTFAFDGVTGGQWWIGPAPDERWQAIDGLASIADVITVEPGAREMTITLRSQRGLYIRGRVLDSKGEPARRSMIGARFGKTYLNVGASTKDDGSFALGPIVEGSYELTAGGSDTLDARSDPITARAGDKDVILRLRAGGGIEGKVIDAKTGEGCRAECACLPSTQSDMKGRSLSSSNQDGSFQWHGLESGSYELTARTSDGRTARAKGVAVKAGENTSDIVLSLEPGAKLRLRYDGDQEKGWSEVQSDGVSVAGDWLVKGTPSVQIVPKGKLTVTLRHKAGVTTCTREVEVAAGEEKEVVLTDEK